MPASARPTRSLCLAIAGVLVGASVLTGCRRPKTPDAPDVWDEDAAPERTEALTSLAPPWPAPARTILDDGLLTFWLHEPGSPALHVRLMLPVSVDAASAESVAVVGEMLRAELRRRLARRGVTVEVEHQPGRLELALHGRDEDRAVVFKVLARALGVPSPRQLLTAARDRLRKRIDDPSSEELATTELVGQLAANVPLERPRAKALESASAESLLRGWEALVDPRRCVLVVHAGHSAPDAGASLGALSSRWSGKGRVRTRDSALARLRTPTGGPRGATGRLAGEGAAPITLVSGKSTGGPVLVLGRIIPTPTDKERSLARLSQRVMQEELDVRLSIAGSEALFIVVVPLTGRQADATALKTIEELATLAGTRQPQQRLFQAAQLWLGGRVVQASLDGEDWTSLWSESVDLATKEAQIGTALARDAAQMLGVKPDELTSWQKDWTDPRAGKPGWAWVVAGADRKVERQLGRVSSVKAQPPSGS